MWISLCHKEIWADRACLLLNKKDKAVAGRRRDLSKASANYRRFWMKDGFGVLCNTMYLCYFEDCRGAFPLIGAWVFASAFHMCA